MLLRLHHTDHGPVLESEGRFKQAPPSFSLDALFAHAEPVDFAAAAFADGKTLSGLTAAALRAPLQSQEVWAAGVTYLRSMNARREESKQAGGDTFYDRVYQADRPELFFKATPHRVAAPGAPVRIRADSQWNVPEPELVLAVSAHGRIFGFTAGNDMSSRDIEGENPLYLPQAKVYHGSAALGPALVITATPPDPQTAIALEIRRGGDTVFAGETTIGRIRRPLPSLVDWLFRDNTFPQGCYLMTGTGIIPPDDFTLRPGDEIRITIEPVGTLINPVA
jgi:2-dehydro-3-deoxy-D-arabinonate dehydratase